MQRAHQVIFWQDVIGDASIIEEFREDIDRLLKGEYKACSVEKLANYNVYSMRLNKKGRLLFTTIEENGVRYLVILEALLNHEYDSSRFLKHGVLKHYLEKNGALLSGQAAEIQEWKSITENEEKRLDECKSEKGPFEFVDRRYYHHQFIKFNLKQEEAITAELPLIISGPAGSGKSCDALSMLTAMKQALVGENGTLLYVTKSAELVRVMEKTWLEMTAGLSTDLHTVKFKTYDQLLEDNLESDLTEEVGECEFIDFIKKRLALFKKLSTTSSDEKLAISAITLRLNEVYQEARIMSGYTADEYLNLGRDSLFEDKNQRKWLRAAFDFYLSTLIKGKFDSSFLNFTCKERFKFIVVDESQDLSSLQLKMLKQISDNICYCLDTHQSLHDALSKRPYLKWLLGGHPSQIELPCSYRCPANIASVANVLIAIKNTLTGGKADKLEYHQMLSDSESGRKGEVIWLDRLANDELTMIKTKGKGSDIAVIISDESYRAEAEKQFTSVFTVEQIKGLEYPVIVLYKPIGKSFFEANRRLPSDGLKQGTHRAKDGDRSAEFGPPFNELFTAFTRASQTLVIYQPIMHENKMICHYLKEAIVKSKVDEKEIKQESTQTTAEDWFERAKLLLLEGRKEQAKRIFINELNYSEQEFAIFECNIERPREEKELKSKPQVISEPKRQDPQVAVVTKPAGQRQIQLPPRKSPELKQSAEVKDEVFNPKQILRNFTKPNILKFLKHPKCVEILFERDVNRDCIFNRLIPIETNAGLFLEVLKENPGIVTIPTKMLYGLVPVNGKKVSIFNKMATIQSKSIIELLSFIVMSDASLDVKELSSKLLDNAYSPVPVLLYLASSNFKYDCLKSWFLLSSKKEEFLKNIPLSAIEKTYRFKDDSDGKKMYSIWSLFCQHADGRKILDLYLTVNDLWKKVPLKLLFNEHRDNSTHEFFYPILYLTKCETGRKIISKILAQQANLDDFFKASVMFSNHSGKFLFVNYLINLTDNNIRVYIKPYLSYYAAHFIKRWRSDAGFTADEFKQMFSHLFFTSHDFVLELLKIEPNTLNFLFAEDVLLQSMELKKAKHTYLEELIYDPLFYPYLLKLFVENPEIGLSIYPHKLLNFIFNLISTEEGLNILKIIILNNSALAMLLGHPEQLCDKHSSGEVLYDILNKSDIGKEILGLIFKANPGLTHEIISDGVVVVKRFNEISDRTNFDMHLAALADTMNYLFNLDAENNCAFLRLITNNHFSELLNTVFDQELPAVGLHDKLSQANIVERMLKLGPSARTILMQIVSNMDDLERIEMISRLLSMDITINQYLIINLIGCLSKGLDSLSMTRFGRSCSVGQSSRSCSLSLFGLLSLNETGVLALLKYFDACPDRYQEVTPGLIFDRILLPMGVRHKTCVIDNLSSLPFFFSERLRENLLIALFKNRQILAAYNYLNRYSLQAINILLSKQDLHGVLYHQLVDFPHLIESFNLNELFIPNVIEAQHPIIFTLAESDMGLKIIELLLLKNANFLTLLASSNAMNDVSSAGRSLYDIFDSSEKGKDILKLLYKANPALVRPQLSLQLVPLYSFFPAELEKSSSTAPKPSW